MHAFRCTTCGAFAYSAASLDRLSGGDRCTHCGGELQAAIAAVRRFGTSRPRRPRPAAPPARADLRRPA